jgi:transposase
MPAIVQSVAQRRTLPMRTPGTPQELQRQRERAIGIVFKQGLTQTAAARILGVHLRRVQEWVAQYRRHGMEGIKAKPVPGRPRKMKRKDLLKLEKLLLKGAICAGFETELWTCPRICSVIKKEFNVSYHPYHLCRILKELGWSAQRPARRASERNEEQIMIWQQQRWVRIKKKLSARGKL